MNTLQKMRHLRQNIMSFKRNDVQEFIEYELKCFNLNNWLSYKTKLLAWEVSRSNENQLERCIKSDLHAYFFKALQTFIQSLHDFFQKKYSWSIIKFYYTTFYLLRCDILLSNHIIIRCGGFYYAKVEIGNKFIQFKKRNIRGDHQMTIALAKKLNEDGEIFDPIFGNEINGDNAYIWLMKNRERINYQTQDFSDPYADVILLHLKSYFQKNKIKDLFEFYNSNVDYSICFDIDHSIIAIPFKKITNIFKKLETDFYFPDEYKRKYISCINFTKDLNIRRAHLEELVK